MTLMSIVIGAIAVVYGALLLVRSVRTWRQGRALKRRERQIRRYVMGNLAPTRKHEP